MGQRVAVTGMAAASAIGMDLDAIAVALRNRRHGLTRAHRFTRWSASPMGEIAEMPGGWSDDRLLDICRHAMRQLATSTAVFERYRPEEIGLFIGTTTAGLRTTLQSMTQFLEASEPKHYRDFVQRSDQHGRLSADLKREFPIRGFDAVVSTACSAGALAIAEARDAIRAGVCRAAIAGGFDVLSEITINGFQALQVVDDEFCRPFSPDRRGMNLAEGGGFLLLEGNALEPLAQLCGVGTASEGYHMTHPDPSGEGMRLTMMRALTDAGIDGQRIDYINAHGTGTIANDQCESKAIHQLFPNGVAFDSTKRWHGHTLAGAGALEAVITIAALLHQSDWGASGERPRTSMHYAMSNSFGFGGNNVSLVFARGKADG